MPLSGAEQKAVARALRDIYTKKLIVSRQPIFTNLKSNTMKNTAKVQSFPPDCKRMSEKISRVRILLTFTP